jgi:L-threonylcarbamoyladenylate synthase
MNKTYNIVTEFNESLKKAENIFNQNGIFIYPTDTIYGIGGNPFSREAMERIIRIKKRDESKSFIFLIGTTGLLQEYIDTADSALNKINSIWPAPVSVIFKLNKKYKELLKQETCAFRIPKNKFCYDLLDRIQLPLISTSVNLEGKKPLNNYKEIITDFSEKVDAIFYSVSENESISSTVIDMTENEPKLIREGMIKFMDLLEKLG